MSISLDSWVSLLNLCRVMSDPLAQAGVKPSKEITAILQHTGTSCDPGIHGFESAILPMNKRENYSQLNS